MAKFIVDFNNKNYDIDEASLSAATNALKSHLSTAMSGSGATINFGGVAYGIDSTKLTAATNDFVSHLGKISGSGSKVTVGGVQYGVDSTKLSNAISDLEAVLGNLHSEGDDNDYTEVIIPSTTVPFQEHAGTGIYAFETPSNVIFNEGEKYLVIFDGVSYEVTIKSFTYTFDGGTTKISYAGNGDIIRTFFAGGQGTVAGLESSSEPFALMQHETMGVLTTSTDATHTIEILGCSQSEEGGSGDDSGLVLNEYGFYYDTKYSRCDGYDSADFFECRYYFKEDKTVDVYYGDEFGYTVNTIYDSNSVTIVYEDGYEDSFQVTSGGKELCIPDGDAAIKLGDSLFVDGDYTYAFTGRGLSLYKDGVVETKFGWTVDVNDTTKTSYGPIVNDAIVDIFEEYPLLSLNGTFKNCKNLTVVPEIPSNVFDMTGTFFGCTSLETAPVIPDGVLCMASTFRDCTNLKTAPVIPDGMLVMEYAFAKCTSLETAPVIPASVTNLNMAFSDCYNLTGNIEINSNPSSYTSCFSKTVKPITITGSCSDGTKRALAKTAKNGNVTY